MSRQHLAQRRHRAQNRANEAGQSARPWQVPAAGAGQSPRRLAARQRAAGPTAGDGAHGRYRTAGPSPGDEAPAGTSSGRPAQRGADHCVGRLRGAGETRPRQPPAGQGNARGGRRRGTPRRSGGRAHDIPSAQHPLPPARGDTTGRHRPARQLRSAEPGHSPVPGRGRGCGRHRGVDERPRLPPARLPAASPGDRVAPDRPGAPSSRRGDPHHRRRPASDQPPGRHLPQSRRCRR
jgi:hypothetical protein